MRDLLISLVCALGIVFVILIVGITIVSDDGFTEDDCAVTWGALAGYPETDEFEMLVEIRPKDKGDVQ